MAFPNYRERREGEVATSGWCHRRVPQVVFSQARHQTVTAFPETAPVAWCGEFEEVARDVKP